MVHLYDNWFDLNRTRGTDYSLDLFAEAVETTYALVWTENARGRRVSVLVNVYPFADGTPTAEQQLYLLAAYRWLLSTQVEVTAVRIIERTNLPVAVGLVSQTANVSFSPGVSP